MDSVAQHIRDAQSLEHVHRLSMALTERLDVPDPTDQGSAFQVLNAAGRDQLLRYEFLHRAEQMFAHLAYRGIDNYTPHACASPSEIEF
ncbi:hypothetical protein DYB32_010221 [Aphanomyces invadans]|uniref:Uncharacterized protein n=1 Tax=Aphanomyces invadans TaxID=157072 RepID=A0A3R7A1V7_9STRA|nr:hypothetical protein DYB32_010221 [Aphanomyces invadans]